MQLRREALNVSLLAHVKQRQLALGNLEDLYGLFRGALPWSCNQT